MSVQEARVNLIAPEIEAETKAWMRYLTFRAWIEDRKVVDLGSTTRFGARMASVLATSTTLVANAPDLEPPYGLEYFETLDACPNNVCVADAETVFCFEALNHEKDLEGFLNKLATCEGNLALGYMPDGRLNRDAFEAMIAQAFEGRPIRFFTQSPNWPFRLIDEAVGEGLLWVAAIGEVSQLDWPTLGLAMPTIDLPALAHDAILGLTRSYPGQLEIAVVANGSSPETLEKLGWIVDSMPGLVHLVVSETNLGYGQGCNRGLDFLSRKGGFDNFGVVNDDILPDPECLCELVQSLRGLEALHVRPGAIGPVSNNVNGAQQVAMPEFASYPELLQATLEYRRSHHSSATQTRQIRGLMLIFTKECLDIVGGFDPSFGIGNFEDDDHNLRCHLAGFSLWIADGAFVFHHGSSTFRDLEVDYTANIQRNAETMANKWNLALPELWVTLESTPASLDLNVPLNAWQSVERFVPLRLNGETIDLVSQATDIEFAAWVISRMRALPREARRSVIASIESAA